MSTFYPSRGNVGLPLPAAPPMSLLPIPGALGKSSAEFLRDYGKTDFSMMINNINNNPAHSRNRCRSPVSQPLRHRHLPASFWQEPNVSSRVRGRYPEYPGRHLLPPGHPLSGHTMQFPVVVPGIHAPVTHSSSVHHHQQGCFNVHGNQNGKIGVVSNSSSSKVQGTSVHRDFLERLQSAQARGYDQVLAASRDFPIAQFLLYNYGLRSLYSGEAGVPNSSTKNSSHCWKNPFDRLPQNGCLTPGPVQLCGEKHPQPDHLEHLKQMASSSPPIVALPGAPKESASPYKGHATVDDLIFHPDAAKHLDPFILQYLRQLQSNSSPESPDVNRLKLFNTNSSPQKNASSPSCSSSSQKCLIDAPSSSLSSLPSMSSSSSPFSKASSTINVSSSVKTSLCGQATLQASSSPTQPERNGDQTVREEERTAPCKDKQPPQSSSTTPCTKPTTQTKRNERERSPRRSPNQERHHSDFDSSPRKFCGFPPRCSVVEDKICQGQMPALPSAAALNFTFPTLCPYLGYNCPKHHTRGPHHFFDCVIKGGSASAALSSSSLSSPSSSVGEDKTRVCQNTRDFSQTPLLLL